MGFPNPFKVVKKIAKGTVKLITKAISWIFPKPEIPDY